MLNKLQKLQLEQREKLARDCIKFKEMGYTYREIAKIVGKTHQRIFQIMKEYNKVNHNGALDKTYTQE